MLLDFLTNTVLNINIFQGIEVRNLSIVTTPVDTGEKQDGKRVETCFSAMRAQWVAGEAGDGCREVVRCDASRSMG